MKSGARNQLEGQIVEIKRGQVMCHVKVRVPAGATICSVMTVQSLDDLGVREGDTVRAVAKAVNVLLSRE